MAKNKLLRRISVAVTALALIATSAVSVAFAKYQTTTTGSDSVQVAKWSFQVKADETDFNAPNAETFTLALKPTEYTNVAADGTATPVGSKLAPGTVGYFAVEAKNTSDVDVLYTVEFTVEDKPTNLKFYYDSAYTNEIVANGSNYSYNFTTAANTANDGELEKSTTGETETFMIYWKWVYEVEPYALTTDTDYDAASTYYTENEGVYTEVDATEAQTNWETAKATYYEKATNDVEDTADGDDARQNNTKMSVTLTIVGTQEVPAEA